MIDIHCHILPGLDDGATSLSETFAMAKKAVKQGIHTVIATPHMNNQYNNEKDAVIQAVDYINAKLIEARISLIVLPGQEILIYEDMVKDLKRGKLLPLNETSYVLVELPNTHVPPFATQLIFDMQIAGYIPVIVHPEENAEFVGNPNSLYEMVKNGALTQINAASLTGANGKKTKKFAMQLIELNLAHFIASNAHNEKKKGFRLRQAYKAVSKQLGVSTTEVIKENGKLLINGDPVIKDAPGRIDGKRRRFF